jgi:hypothetical protein
MKRRRGSQGVRDRSDGNGFTVLDGVALVLGAAVASVHLRELVGQSRPLTELGWALLWITFTGIALSAAGPFLFVERRYVRRPVGYPRAGDWLWLALGLPWTIAAALRLAPSTALAGTPPSARLDGIVLGLSLAVASLLAMGMVWKTWVLAPPTPPGSREPAPWTDRVGLVLAVAWPLQCGFGLVVLG